MIALDCLEEMNAEPFDLIAADACEHRFTRGFNIAIDKISAEGAAGQAGRDYGLKKDLVAAQDAECRMKFMRSSRKADELGPGFGERRRLGECSAVENQSLVGAENQPARPVRCDSTRLGLRQIRDDLGCRCAFVAQRCFHSTFIDRTGDRFERDPCRCKKRLPRCAFRGEYQRRLALPKAVHAKPCLTMNFLGTNLGAMDTLKIDDRRCGLFDGAPGDIDHRPAMLGKEPARLRDLLAHGDTIDIG